MKVTPRVKSNTIALAVFFVGYGLGYLVHDIKDANKVTPLPPFPTVSPVATCIYPQTTIDSLRVEVNDYRLSKGLPQLVDDKSLMDYAAARVNEIVDTTVFSHETAYGSYDQWIKGTSDQAPQGIASVAEDLANNQVNACQTIQGFAASPAHNDTILNPKATFIGIGYENGYVVLEIGNK